MKILFFPVFLFIALALSLIYIPRQQYKKYLLYAVISGGLGNMIISFVLIGVLKVVRYTDLGIFNVLGYNYLEPFAWVFIQMLFLYFLPARRWFRYGYILAFSGISVGFGDVIRNLGVSVASNLTMLRWLSPLIFLAWWGFAAWFFRSNESKNRAWN